MSKIIRQILLTFPFETSLSKFGVGINLDGLLIDKSAQAISSVLIKSTFGQVGSFL